MLISLKRDLPDLTFTCFLIILGIRKYQRDYSVKCFKLTIIRDSNQNTFMIAVLSPLCVNVNVFKSIEKLRL